MEKNLTSINAILACDKNYGIGYKNGLPWPHNEEDMKWFRENTKNSVVVMGRKTWESIGSKPLPHRINYIISKSNFENLKTQIDEDGYSLYAFPLNGAVDGGIYQNIQYIKTISNPEKIWIIGGAEIYKSTIPFCNNIYLTQFNDEYECDKYISKDVFDGFVKLTSKKGLDCEFSIWNKM